MRVQPHGMPWGYSVFLSFSLRLSQGSALLFTMPRAVQLLCSVIHVARTFAFLLSSYQSLTAGWLQFHLKQQEKGHGVRTGTFLTSHFRRLASFSPLTMTTITWPSRGWLIKSFKVPPLVSFFSSLHMGHMTKTWFITLSTNEGPNTVLNIAFAV